MDYTKHVSTKETPQSESIPFTQQVKNSAGGYAWEVNDWVRLDRFLILGSEGGTYYIGEKKLTVENANAIVRCLDSDYKKAIDRICEISLGGRAPKNDPAIFALALAASHKNPDARKYALGNINKVCRIGTHLFMFVSMVSNLRGWGRGLRDAVRNWYDKDTSDLAYQVIKYRNRSGYTHRDVFRLAHPIVSADDKERFALYKWIARDEVTDGIPQLLADFLKLQEAKTVKDVTSLLFANKSLSWEMIPTEHLTSPAVWETLLPHMPMTAMIRNLGRMTANGTLKPMSEAAKVVVKKLSNAEAIHKSRLHPIAILGALKTYEQGHGVKGSLSWDKVSTIIDALDDAFYVAFKNVEPTGKNTLLALDVSASMTWYNIAGMPGLNPRVASAALALVTARTEPNYEIVCFASGSGYDKKRKNEIYSGLCRAPFTKQSSLTDACDKIDGMWAGGTDCSLPMTYATKKKLAIDTFVVYTDNETWAGSIHPAQALKKFRKAMGIPAKLVVVGMVSNNVSIADPSDAGMLDVVGFDTATPNLISDFSKN